MALRLNNRVPLSDSAAELLHSIGQRMEANGEHIVAFVEPSSNTVYVNLDGVSRLEIEWQRGSVICGLSLSVYVRDYAPDHGCSGEVLVALCATVEAATAVAAQIFGESGLI